MSNGPKIMTASAVGLLLSMGLCGLSGVTGKASGFFIGSGVLVLVASIVGFFVGLVWAVVESLTRK